MPLTSQTTSLVGERATCVCECACKIHGNLKSFQWNEQKIATETNELCIPQFHASTQNQRNVFGWQRLSVQTDALMEFSMEISTPRVYILSIQKCAQWIVMATKNTICWKWCHGISVTDIPSVFSNFSIGLVGSCNSSLHACMHHKVRHFASFRL